jgi:glycosyltransferase involved in cell wall biosynthesis
VLSFSIVTPSLNQGRFIERTIRSVLEQDYAPLEYIVCDGGSTDETAGVLTTYAERVKVVSERDTGQASAVNKGIRLSSGDLIGWLNSDEVYLPGALTQVADCFNQRPEADVVYGDAHLIDAHDAVTGAYYTEPWNPARLAERCFLCQPAVFFRRSVVERFGALDEHLHYCLDYEYWLRLASAGATFKYSPTILAGSRLHASSKTLRARLDSSVADQQITHKSLRAQKCVRPADLPEPIRICGESIVAAARRIVGSQEIHKYRNENEGWKKEFYQRPRRMPLPEIHHEEHEDGQ